MSLILAVSATDQIEKYGAYAGIAAILGLAVLSLLYFSQAREVKRLREWAGRAPERAAEAQAQAQARAAAAAQPRPVTPRVSAPAGSTPSAAAAGVASVGAAQASPGSGTPAADGSAPTTPAPGTPDPTSAPAGARAAVAAAAGAAPASASVATKPTSSEDNHKASEPPQTPSERLPAAATAVAQTAPPPAAAPRTGKPAAASAPAAPAGSPASGTPPAAAVPGATGAGKRSATQVDRELAAGVTPPPRRPASVPATPAGAAPRREPARGGRDGSVTRYVVIGLGALVLIAGAIFGITRIGGGEDSSTPPNAIQGGSQSRQDAGKSQDTGKSAAGGDARVVRGETKVYVLNGTTVPGLAGQLQNQLKRAGFDTTGKANAPNQARSATTITYLPGSKPAANEVGRVLKVDAIEPIDGTTQGVACPPGAACDLNVVVTVGADRTQ